MYVYVCIYVSLYCKMWQHCNLSSVIPASHIFIYLNGLFIIRILYHVRRILNRVRHKRQYIRTVRSRTTTLNSANAQTNGIYHLTEAFPDEYPYKLIYDHRSYEIAIPQLHQLMAQYSCMNTMCDYRGMDIWARINTIGSGRDGPYWDQNRSNLMQTSDSGFAEISDIITSQYYIENPGNN